jgi:hypothetical protein
MESLVVFMPSHAIHKVVGERICGFNSDEIDGLVDDDTRTGVAALGLRGRYWLRPAGTHDLGRVSCRALLADAKEIVARFGEKGLCYYILHH